MRSFPIRQFVRRAAGVAGGAVLLASGCSSPTASDQQQQQQQPPPPPPVITPTHPLGNIVRTDAIPGEPYGVAISPSGTIFAALIGSNALARGTLAGKDFTETVVVGNQPPHVVFNASATRVYATLQAGQAVAVVDPATNKVITQIPLPGDGFNLAVSADGKRVYATTSTGILAVIDAATNTIVKQLDVGPAANGLAFAPDGVTLYVSSRDAGTVVAVNTASDEITRTYHTGGAPQRLAVSPDGSLVFAADEASGLDVIDVASGLVQHESFGSAAYGLAMSPDGAVLYVTLPAVGQVLVLDRVSRATVATLTVGGRPRNVTFSADGSTALIANEAAIVFVQ